MSTAKNILLAGRGSAERGSAPRLPSRPGPCQILGASGAFVLYTAADWLAFGAGLRAGEFDGGGRPECPRSAPQGKR
jgi:hypothetical protein